MDDRKGTNDARRRVKDVTRIKSREAKRVDVTTDNRRSTDEESRKEARQKVRVVLDLFATKRRWRHLGWTFLIF